MGMAEERVECPECRGREVCRLNQRAGEQLWQCGRCLHEFSTPLPAPPPLVPERDPDDLRSWEPCAHGCGEKFQYPPEKRRHEALCLGRRTETGSKPMEETVAKLTCEKCPDQRFGSPQALGAHRRYVHDGAGAVRRGKAPSERAKNLAATLRARRPAAPAPTSDGVTAQLLAQLRAKREEILAGVPELQEVDRAIAALEALGGARPTAG